MLHLHILLWLTGAPTAGEMKKLLQTESFRGCVCNYISRTIKVSFDEHNRDTVRNFKKPRESVSYSCPLDPRIEEYTLKAGEMEIMLAASVQVHKCKQHACLFLVNGEWVCKRWALFDLSSNDYIEENGSWGVKRFYPYFNTWNPAILQSIRANHDIKLITNGGDTKDITLYITNYATKKQRHSFNAHALLAKRLAFHNLQEKGNSSYAEVNKKLLAHCTNTLTWEQEFSGPEVVSYLMGWGD